VYRTIQSFRYKISLTSNAYVIIYAGWSGWYDSDLKNIFKLVNSITFLLFFLCLCIVFIIIAKCSNNYSYKCWKIKFLVNSSFFFYWTLDYSRSHYDSPNIIGISWKTIFTFHVQNSRFIICMYRQPSRSFCHRKLFRGKQETKLHVNE
jgi:hypothetical protein